MTTQQSAARRDISLLPNPYPYRAMLCICSDLDETPSAQVYFDTSDFLNTTANTRFGKGVGLETGNTMYFYMPDGEFSYWSASESERARIREMMRDGRIDAIHSFGDLASRREQAVETLEHLDAEDCRLKVWIDHAVAPSNIGGDIMQGFGDVKGHPAYHTDLSLDYGICYVSRGRVTSVQGQDTSLSCRGILHRSAPMASLRTLAKEVAKISLATLGSQKYRMHRSNRLLRDVTLRDGGAAVEFLRCNPNPAGVSVGDNARGLADALRGDVLDRLEKRAGRSVVYTHLGKKIDPQTGFDSRTRGALEGLAERMRAGRLLVTTTRRLLDYAYMQQKLSWTSSMQGDVVVVDVASNGHDLCFDGLSFEVPAGIECRLSIDGETQSQALSRPQGRRSILSLPWPTPTR